MNALNEIVIELQKQPNLTPKDFNKLLKDARNSYVQVNLVSFIRVQDNLNLSHNQQNNNHEKLNPQNIGSCTCCRAKQCIDGRFAVLDNIKDPEQLEKAIARMSQSDRDAYLRGAA